MLDTTRSRLRWLSFQAPTLLPKQSTAPPKQSLNSRAWHKGVKVSQWQCEELPGANFMCAARGRDICHRHDYSDYAVALLKLGQVCSQGVFAKARSPRRVYQGAVTKAQSPRRVHQGAFTKARSPKRVHQSAFTKARSPRRVHQSAFTKARSPRRVYQGAITKARLLRRFHQGAFTKASSP